MTIVPKRDQVAVKIDAPADMTNGGIVLPQSSQDFPKTGTVVAVGPGKYENGCLVPMNLQSGDRVVFKTWQSPEIQVDGERLNLMTAESILAVIQD